MKDLQKDWLRRRRSAVFAWAGVINSSAVYKSYKRCLVTLTYADGADFAVDHLRKYLNNLTRLKSCVVHAYAWVMELQERGVPHYHVVVIYEGHFPTPDTSGMWTHGMSNVRYRIRTVYYICTYVSKTYQLDYQNMPKGAHGVGLYIRDKQLRLDLRVARMDARDRELYKIGGLQEVKENKVKPAMFRAEYVASTLTRGLADLYAGVNSPLDTDQGKE